MFFFDFFALIFGCIRISMIIAILIQYLINTFEETRLKALLGFATALLFIYAIIILWKVGKIICGYCKGEIN